MALSFKKILQFLAFLTLGVVILVLVFRSQNAAFQDQCRLDGVPADQCSLIDKLWNDFANVNPFWMLLVVVAFTVSNVFRAQRWLMLLEPLGYKARFANSFWAILLGYFANLGIPRMGEVVRAGSLARYERIPLQQVVGTMVIDRLMDLLCMALAVGLAFVLEGDTLLAFLQQRPAGQASGGGGLLAQPLLWIFLALMLAGGAVLWFTRDFLSRQPLFRKIAGLLEGFYAGLRSVFRLGNPGLFLFYSIGIWVMFYLQCLFNLKAFAPTAGLSASAALMVFVFGTLGFVVPTPGGMGTFHYLVKVGLLLYGIQGADAFSYSMIAFFAIQIFYNIIGGLLALTLLPLLNKKKPA